MEKAFAKKKNWAETPTPRIHTEQSRFMIRLLQNEFEKGVWKEFKLTNRIRLH